MVLANEDMPSVHTALTLKTTGGADSVSKMHAKAADYDAGT